MFKKALIALAFVIGAQCASAALPAFNQKFENLVLFCMEQEETKKQKIAFLDQQIVKQYKKLDALRKISSEIGDVRKALTNLEWRANDLSDLMGKLLEDKDADPELPFS